MSAFAGIVTFDGVAIDRRGEDGAARAVTRSTLQKGRAALRRVDGALFAQRISPAQAGEFGQAQPLTGSNGRTLFVAQARLDNREELGSALGLTPAELARTSDSSLIQRTQARR